MDSSRTAPFRSILALLVVIGMAAPACKPKAQGPATAEVPTPYPTEASGEESDATLDVKRVSVFPDGTARPETVKVKAKTQIVVWALKGDGELKVNFPDSPFGETPKQPECAGRFCVILYPPRKDSDKPPTEGHEGRVYEYTVQVTSAGETTTADPHTEVIP